MTPETQKGGGRTESERPRSLREIIRDWDESGAEKTSLYYRLYGEMLKERATKLDGAK